jgi:AcrR family transcriptional regulator
MDRKKIQEQRMRGYFIQATVEILKGEGLTGVSVRSVAEKAGYSYATLYNYFNDLNDLIFECIKEFQSDCETIVKGRVKKAESGKSKLKATVLAYTEYFIEYPGVFDLFYLEKMGNIGNKQSISELIYNFLDKLCESDWNYCIENDIITMEMAEKKRRLLRYTVMGMLLFFQNRLQPCGYNEFIELLTRQVCEIIDL